MFNFISNKYFKSYDNPPLEHTTFAPLFEIMRMCNKRDIIK